MKILSGSDLAGFIMQRQLRQFRATAHRLGRPASLAIVQTIDDPVINTYVRLKQTYADDVEARVRVHSIEQSDTTTLIDQLNSDPDVDGIIIQLPLSNESQQEELLAQVHPTKDVDGLGPKTKFIPATANAIMWLLAGYNIEPAQHKVLLIGNGRLVGQPMAKLLRSSGIEPMIADRSTNNLQELLDANDLVITATGQSGLITNDMLHEGHIVIDAGVASESGVNKGDIADDVYESGAIQSISAQRGGVGPLTVCALFDNLLQAAE